MLLFLNIILEVDKVRFVEAGSHANLAKEIVKLLLVRLTYQFILPNK
jgi:hypothetical protein